MPETLQDIGEKLIGNEEEDFLSETIALNAKVMKDKKEPKESTKPPQKVYYTRAKQAKNLKKQKSVRFLPGIPIMFGLSTPPKRFVGGYGRYRSVWSLTTSPVK